MEDFRLKEIGYFLEHLYQDSIMDDFLDTNYELLRGDYIEHKNNRDCFFLDDYFIVLNFFYALFLGFEMKREKSPHKESNKKVHYLASYLHFP